MKDIINLVKAKRQLDKDVKAAVIKHANNDADFIAVSRKLKLSCTCGAIAEVWSNNGWIIATAEENWQRSHMNNVGCNPMSLVIIN